VINETSAVAFRQNLGEYLNLVQYRKDSVLIKKDGKPVAALIDANLFQNIRRMQERFDALCARFAEGFAQVPEAEGMAEIEEATKLARQEVVAELKAAGKWPGEGVAISSVSSAPTLAPAASQRRRKSPVAKTTAAR
jgi:prevent-host-death family protein